MRAGVDFQAVGGLEGLAGGRVAERSVRPASDSLRASGDGTAAFDAGTAGFGAEVRRAQPAGGPRKGYEDRCVSIPFRSVLS